MNPNLYIFVINTSDSMNAYKTSIENYIHSEIEKIKINENLNNTFIAIISYSDKNQKVLQQPIKIKKFNEVKKLIFSGSANPKIL